MPTSAPGNRHLAEHGFTPGRRFAEHGFTLVELMVVLTIIALASAAALWALPDPHGRVMDEAARFAVRARAAHEAAIVEARPVGLWVTTGGYGFDRRVAGRWVAMADKPLRVERWAEGTRATMAGVSGAADERLRIVYDTTGLADRPAQVTLSRNGARAVVDLAADGTIRVAG